MASSRWTVEQANAWAARQPWLVGCNFIPSTAINQLEMFQAADFDPETIDRELSWAAGLGFNTARVYLHDLLWQEDAPGFQSRLDRFLDLAAGRGIRPLLVIFDDCWNNNPASGRQPAPRPGIHNSGWVQSPSEAVVRDASAWGRLEEYVHGLLGAFGKDERILLWDLYNEPGNQGLNEASLPLLRMVFQWAREAGPGQPISAGVWYDNAALNEFQLANSDVITFHNYCEPENLRAQIRELKGLGRPLICTEYMARSRGSLFQTCLPVFKEEGVGCLNWGLVAGKTNTIFAWDTPLPEAAEPPVWFHDIFRADGSLFSQEEVDCIRRLTGVR